MSCLHSLIILPKIEVLCIDDHSPDNSTAIIKEFIEKDNRVKLIRPKEWGGLSQAINIGVENSRGDYIMFIDSDDIITTNAIELLYDLIVGKRPKMMCPTALKL